MHHIASNKISQREVEFGWPSICELTPSLSCCAVYSARWEAVVSVAVRMSNCGDRRVQLCSLIPGSQLPFLLHYCPLMPNVKFPYKTVTLYQIESTHFKTQQKCHAYNSCLPNCHRHKTPCNVDWLYSASRYSMQSLVCVMWSHSIQTVHKYRNISSLLVHAYKPLAM